MLKTAAQSVLPRLMACIGSTQGVTAPQKFLSQSPSCHKKLTITDHFDFDKKVINSEKPTIVNFHADWCAPCEILTAKWVELLENSNEIDLVTINVDHHSDLVETFEVKAVPAVLAFRNGVVVDKFIGLVDANGMEAILDKLKKKPDESQ